MAAIIESLALPRLAFVPELPQLTATHLPHRYSNAACIPVSLHWISKPRLLPFLPRPCDPSITGTTKVRVLLLTAPPPPPPPLRVR
ncbi:hypothetical protein E2C01_093545 [Portunus trituberculatus]|uniref:Uncharacterized protein n=1 Tax=Portunus trituberculatus TaxID=210409 RepID=A0A5B7JTT8_PORTR|nr:hypothetical protein [Portunus trituberculatus]